MPDAEPPPVLNGVAHVDTLRAHSTVWRVHHSSRAAQAMNARAQPDADGGGRFDSLDGAYTYLYVAASMEGAIAETLCRDLPLQRPGDRLLPAAILRSRLLTELTVTEDVPVVALHGPHLSAIGQDLWLTKCDVAQYVRTRQWAAAVLVATPAARGLAYRCRHDEDQMAWMLTTVPGAPLHPGLAPKGESLRLDGDVGKYLVSQTLLLHSAALDLTVPNSSN